MLSQGICTTPMCTAGRASVEQMDSVYQANASNLQSFQSAHDAILSTFQSYWITIDEWIPFNPECCAIQQLGAQADQLTMQMQQALGQNPVSAGPGSQSQSPDWLSGLFGASGKWVLIFGVLALFAWERR